jgi:hypothetical protein
MMNPIRLEYLNPKTESTIVDPALLENLKFTCPAESPSSGLEIFVEI